MRNSCAASVMVSVVLGVCTLTALGAGEDPYRARPARTKLGSPVELPFEAKSAPPMVEAMINGKGPFKLAIDTGTAGMVLDDDVVTTLGLGDFRKVKVRLPGVEQVQIETVVRLKTVAIGDAEFSDIDAIVIDYDKVYDGKRDRDGTIGFGAFSGCLLTLDYPRGIVRLEKGELPLDDEREILVFAPVHGVPRLQLELRGFMGWMTIDSGRAGTLTIAESEKDRIKLLNEDEASIARGPTTHVADTLEVPAKGAMALGRHLLLEPLVHFRGPESALGHKVLRNFSITFDQKNDRVRFLRDSTEPIDFLPPPKFGVYISFRQRVPYVQRVTPGSVASKLPIYPGDRILAIDGKRAHRFNAVTLRQYLETHDSIVLKLDNDGHPLLVPLRVDP